MPRYDPAFAFMSREALENMRLHRERLEAECRASFPADTPETFLRPVARAYVEIAGWKTPACPSTCRRI